MSTLEARIAEVLGAHLKRNIKSCDCGWADIGKRHYEHVAAMLAPVIADAKVEALRGAADDQTLRLSGHGGISITRLRIRADNLEAS